jgi:hypothetical protein
MIKQVLNQMDISFYAEMALGLFCAVFIAIVIRTLLTKSEVTHQQAKIVLGESNEDQR